MIPADSIKKKITVPKTARYFVLGEPGRKIKSVWFVFHGYAQLADHFIKKFELLNNGENLIVAPEGLNRFYRKGFDGDIGASWMTREDRTDDITDYVNYLDLVYKEIRSQLPNPELKINAIGFSQGGATVSRWMSTGECKIDQLILWASAFPTDLDFDMNREKINSANTVLVIGKEDEFVNPEQLQQYTALLNKKAIKFRLITFEGKHVIDQAALKQLVEELAARK